MELLLPGERKHLRPAFSTYSQVIVWTEPGFLQQHMEQDKVCIKLKQEFTQGLRETFFPHQYNPTDDLLTTLPSWITLWYYERACPPTSKSYRLLNQKGMST